VRSIEQDLPLALELFATMAEAGLGFDAALAKIVRAQGADHALTSEFVNFQYDMLAGMARSQALRQLAKRRGPAVAHRLHVGADSRRNRLAPAWPKRCSIRRSTCGNGGVRMQLLQAQALPVKLVFPLVVCFLPGIFVSTLAPVLFQMVEVANSVLRSGR
jgi:tight adherence protein C